MIAQHKTAETMDKLAEEIYFNLCDKKIMNTDRKDIVIEAMQAYHEAKLKEITDADIVKWARQWEYKDKIELSPSDMAAVCLIEAAKAMRDGLIKHQ